MNACPCIIKGRHYPSQRAAASALGVTPMAINYHLDKYGHGDFLGRDWKAKVPWKLPVKIRGVEYDSQAQAAETLGVSRAAISLAKRKGRLDQVGLGRTS